MAGAGHLMFERAAAIYHLQADVAAPLVPFTRFVDFLGKANEADGASYWREQLAGTVTANSQPCRTPNTNQPRPAQRYERILNLRSRTKQGESVAIPIILRADWALTVAQYAACDDVVFAVTLSARNAPVPGITELLAPTATTVPFRGRIDRRHMVHKFLDNMQRQAMDMIPYEHTGLQRIRSSHQTWRRLWTLATSSSFIRRWAQTATQASPA
jgi:hypothetical protein